MSVISDLLVQRMGESFLRRGQEKRAKKQKEAEYETFLDRKGKEMDFEYSKEQEQISKRNK